MLSRYRLHFAGKSAAEAEDFVHWVRQRALDAGKLDDPNWTAKLASGCFVGSALRWYTSLDHGVRGDWDALQQAIFLRYSKDFEEGSSLSLRIRIVPTAAPAAASPNLSKPLSANLSQTIATPHLAEGIEVEYESLPPIDDPPSFFIPNNQIPDCDVLGMKWYSDPTKTTRLFLGLCGVNLITRTGSPDSSYAGPFLTKPWKISRSANAQGTLSLRVISDSGLLQSRKASGYQFQPN
ncbi:hypothetical protein M407DRAFT_31279 [Tulasnella calospora MUT 4182]|uniref:Retrotransposon gag domain-containing protein n=1 Tax=Tulasnella calospora MUT 4182 TaxID=1051891 RepID=A0A0C3Q5V7_9AGAM|nr:hypothetical protein M407DRAFT_31279 [Tulasnella calospora MUT 4182]